jgi:queuine tRNA-ribosyltransferase
MELASIHNLFFYLNLIKEARKRIIDNSFKVWKEEIIKNLSININSLQED